MQLVQNGKLEATNNQPSLNGMVDGRGTNAEKGQKFQDCNGNTTTMLDETSAHQAITDSESVFQVLVRLIHDEGM